MVNQEELTKKRCSYSGYLPLKKKFKANGSPIKGGGGVGGNTGIPVTNQETYTILLSW